MTVDFCMGGFSLTKGKPSLIVLCGHALNNLENNKRTMRLPKSVCVRRRSCFWFSETKSVALEQHSLLQF